MKLYSKNLFTKASLLLVLGYFLTFLSFYFSNVLFADKAFFTYLWYFVQKATFLLLPLISALLALIADAYLGFKRALINLIPLSAAKLIYSLPYYYLVIVYEPLYDSGDALLYSLLQSMLECIFLYAFTLLIFLLMKFIIDRVSKKSATRGELLKENTGLDFANPVSLTFMISSLLCFLYFFIVEIVDTVSVISRYSGRLTGAEIFYIVFSYIFDVILLAIHYAALVYVKNYVIKSRLREEDEISE